MKFSIQNVEDAENDILELFRFVKYNDSYNNAVKLIDEIEERCFTLEYFPDRGHIPPELERIGIFGYREIHQKPYRIIYEIFERIVTILCVFDGRRDLQDVLEKRLLR